MRWHMKDSLMIVLMVLIGTLILRCFFAHDWLLMAYWCVNFVIAAIKFLEGGGS